MYKTSEILYNNRNVSTITTRIHDTTPRHDIIKAKL